MENPTDDIPFRATPVREAPRRQGVAGPALSPTQAPEGQRASVAATGTQGGLSGVAKDLGRRAHDLRHQAVRLEQQRTFLDAAEVEFHKAVEMIGEVLPGLQNGSISLMQALQTSQAGDDPQDLSSRFAAARLACEEHEAAAALLTSNLFRLEFAWEQYAQSLQEARRTFGAA